MYSISLFGCSQFLKKKNRLTKWVVLITSLYFAQVSLLYSPAHCFDVSSHICLNRANKKTFFFWDHPFPSAVWLLLGQVWKIQKIKRIWPVLIRLLLALRFPMYYVLPLQAFTRRYESLSTVSSLLIKVDPCSQNQHGDIIKCTPLMYFLHFLGQTMMSQVRAHTENDLIKFSFREHSLIFTSLRKPDCKVWHVSRRGAPASSKNPHQSAPSRPEIRTNSLYTGRKSAPFNFTQTKNPHQSATHGMKFPFPYGMKFPLNTLNKMSAARRFSLRVGGVSKCLVGGKSIFIVILQRAMNLVIWRILLF